MKYLLNEEEYKELKTKASNCNYGKLPVNILQELCTRIADHEPVNWGWNGPDPKPWGCIYSVEEVKILQIESEETISL